MSKDSEMRFVSRATPVLDFDLALSYSSNLREPRHAGRCHRLLIGINPPVLETGEQNWLAYALSDVAHDVGQTAGKIAQCHFMVGRTPWSARVPLDPLFARRIRFLHRQSGPTGASAADQGSAPPSTRRMRHAAGFADGGR